VPWALPVSRSFARRRLLLLVIDPVWMIWTLKLDLLFFDVRCLPFQAASESAREHSSVDRKGCTDDVGRPVRANEHDGICDFFGSTHALCRNVCLEEICFVFLRLRKTVEHSRFCRTRPTMLTRTSVPASSMAADFVMPSTACLLPTKAAALGTPTLPYEDEMLTMLPLPCRGIARIKGDTHCRPRAWLRKVEQISDLEAITFEIGRTNCASLEEDPIII
jgi:hypothetical protein